MEATVNKKTTRSSFRIDQKVIVNLNKQSLEHLSILGLSKIGVLIARYCGVERGNPKLEVARHLLGKLAYIEVAKGENKHFYGSLYVPLSWLEKLTPQEENKIKLRREWFKTARQRNVKEVEHPYTHIFK
jgi:hypothetical protein